SPLQQGMLLHHMTAVDVDMYLSFFVLKLNSEDLLNKMVNGFRTLVTRHDTMRTNFFWDGLTEAAQVVLKQCQLAVEYVALDEYTSTAQAVTQLEGHRARHMSLQNGPLLQLKVGQCAQKAECFVLLEHHHLVIDHIGLEVMVEELAALILDKPQALMPSTPYRNIVAYAKAQNVDDKGVNYFKQKFADFEDATILFSADTHYELSGSQRLLNATTSQRLRQLSVGAGYSVGAIFHACWAMVAGSCANAQDVAFGTVLSGRLNDFTSTQRTMGLAINTLPMRVSFAGTSLEGISVDELMTQVSQTLLELIDVEQTPLSVAMNQMMSSDMIHSLLNYRHSSNIMGENQIIQGMEIVEVKERNNYAVAVDIDDYGAAGGFNITVSTSNGADAVKVQDYLANAIAKLLDCLEHAPHTTISTLGFLGT
ncbi:MAG: condensation domain-containing protein, partial [Psychrosphaera sp.]|nr:condensation domain-containing protein [Psychrosphaera sp.]